MLKIYSYPGISAAVVNIPVGRAFVKCEFVDGNPDARIAKPAVFKTTNSAVQFIVEHSKLFGKSIFLYETIGEPEPAAVPKSASVTVPVISEDEHEEIETTEYPEVKSFEDAVAILKEIPGVKATQLRTPASAKKVANLYHIVFPNYDFE